jgi:hypothetical protein
LRSRGSSSPAVMRAAAQPPRAPAAAAPDLSPNVLRHLHHWTAAALALVAPRLKIAEQTVEGPPRLTETISRYPSPSSLLRAAASSAGLFCWTATYSQTRRSDSAIYENSLRHLNAAPARGSCWTLAAIKSRPQSESRRRVDERPSLVTSIAPPFLQGHANAPRCM